MPALMVALVIGLVIGVIQATTQINEVTLTYIPKIIAIYATLIAFSGFIMDRLINFTTHIFSDFSRYVQ
jgi:flagellar biosynthetic protein FliQ